MIVYICQSIAVGRVLETAASLLTWLHYTFRKFGWKNSSELTAPQLVRQASSEKKVGIGNDDIRWPRTETALKCCRKTSTIPDQKSLHFKITPLLRFCGASLKVLISRRMKIRPWRAHTRSQRITCQSAVADHFACKIVCS